LSAMFDTEREIPYQIIWSHSLASVARRSSGVVATMHTVWAMIEQAAPWGLCRRNCHDQSRGYRSLLAAASCLIVACAGCFTCNSHGAGVTPWYSMRILWPRLLWIVSYSTMKNAILTVLLLLLVLSFCALLVVRSRIASRYVFFCNFAVERWTALQF